MRLTTLHCSVMTLSRLGQYNSTPFMALDLNRPAPGPGRHPAAVFLTCFAVIRAPAPDRSILTRPNRPSAGATLHFQQELEVRLAGPLFGTAGKAGLSSGRLRHTETNLGQE